MKDVPIVSDPRLTGQVFHEIGIHHDGFTVFRKFQTNHFVCSDQPLDVTGFRFLKDVMLIFVKHPADAKPGLTQIESRNCKIHFFTPFIFAFFLRFIVIFPFG